MHTLCKAHTGVRSLIVLAFFVGLWAPTFTAGQVVESTGFEASDGWNLGFICDPSVFTNCPGPPLPEGCTGDPIADGNCCWDDPNPNTGWFTSMSSEHCQEPHIDASNPATGDQHLRFSPDANGGNPPGCIGGFHVSNCRITAFTPSMGGPFPPTPTTISYKIAQGAESGVSPWGSSFRYLTVSDSSTEWWGHYHYFSYYGFAYVYDYGLGDHYTIGFTAGSGQYDTITTHIDPCYRDPVTGERIGRVTYDWNGVEGVYEQAAGLTHLDQWIGRAIFVHDNNIYDWDIDDYSVVRSDPCDYHCGNNIADIDWGEHCDGTDDANCPGRCIPPGEEGACTCTRDGVSCDTATEVHNGGNGPFLTHGGYFTYTADTPFTSIHTCDSCDTKILWDFDAECESSAYTNDECSGDEPDTDPSAPCYVASGNAPSWQSCLCVPTVPGETYVFAISFRRWLPPPPGFEIVMDIRKKLTCGEPIPNGACCDGETGICTDAVPVEQCTCPQCTWSENELCSAVECEPTAVGVPTLSEWGLATLAILLLAGTARAFSTHGRSAVNPPRG